MTYDSTNPEKYEWVPLNYIQQEKGNTLPIEFDESFPFPVKRIYTVTGNRTHIRGGHAHQQEEEVFICVSGNCKARLDTGAGSEVFDLDTPKKALWVKTYCWHEFFDFSDDAVLLCISSVPYTPGTGNYITDKSEFYEATKA